jgi:hypothetical protein
LLRPVAGLLHLGTLRLPVKSAKDTTIEKLAAKLPPFGMLAKDEWHMGGGKADAQTIGLSALLRQRYPEHAHHYSAVKAEKASKPLLRAKPLPLTSGGAVAARTDLPARLILMASDGSVAPREYAISLKKEATREELRELLTPLCGLDESSEQLVVFSAEIFVPRLSSRMRATCRHREWALGARAELHGYGPQHMGEDDASLAKKLNVGTRLANRFTTFVATRLPRGRGGAVHLRTAAQHEVTHKRARDIRMFGATSSLTSKKPFGCIALLHMRESTRGGLKAEKELQDKLEAFLKPFLKDEAEYEKPSLFHADASGIFEETQSYYGRATAAEAPYRTEKPCSDDAVCFVGADWGEEALEVFDVEAMVAPRDLDASAVADRKGELETLNQEWEEQRSATRGSRVLNELAAASLVSWTQHMVRPLARLLLPWRLL